MKVESTSSNNFVQYYTKIDSYKAGSGWTLWQ